MRLTDLFVAALLSIAGLALLFAVIPIGVPKEAASGVGLQPDVMPRVLAGLMTGLSLLLFVKTAVTPATSVAESASVRGRNWLFLMVQGLIFTIAFLVFLKFGFVIGAPLLILAFLFMMGERRPIALVLMTALVPLVLWLFFWKLLGFPLP